MTYQLRERPDGQVEIVVNRPTIVGIMSDRDMAARFVAFLQIEEPELVEEQPAGFATAAAAGVRGKGGYHGEAQPDRDQHSHIDVTLEKVAVRGRYHGADATRAFSVIRTGRTPA